MIKKKKLGKVFVGLSGGVDSSVSAAILQEKGYEVTGVFIKVWQPDFYKCSWREDRLDAMRVCAKLKIPFLTLDLEKEYKKEVVDYMIREYEIGRTPNPDVMCNKYIKFGGFFNWAIKNGADYVATGHYAKIERDKKSNKYLLLAGDDKNKDQSYFLWTLTQTQLSKTIFPIGDIEKSQVRRLAKKYNLPTAEKKDSQGLCFIGKIDMAEFLKHFLSPKLGKVLDEKGNVIGQHQGAVFYTIGQRHGFKINQNSPQGDRNFILAKDIKKNTLTVSDKIKTKKFSTEIYLSNLNWTRGELPDKSKRYQARVRYRQPLFFCRLGEVDDNKCQIVFENDKNIIAPGQSLVLYDDRVCLGGGIIL